MSSCARKSFGTVAWYTAKKLLTIKENRPTKDLKKDKTKQNKPPKINQKPQQKENPNKQKPNQTNQTKTTPNQTKNALPPKNNKIEHIQQNNEARFQIQPLVIERARIFSSS